MEAEASAKAIRRLGIDEGGEPKNWLFKGLSKVKNGLKKITGFKAAEGKIREKSDAELIAARDEYQQAFDELAAYVAEEMRAAGMSEDNIREMALVGQTYHDHSLDDRILAYQSDPELGVAKKTSRLNNIWHQSSGKKKFMIALGVGAAAGATAATAGVLIPAIATGWVGTALSGGIAGKAAGLSTAFRFNKRRSTAVVGQDAEGLDITNARERWIASDSRKAQARDAAYRAGEFVDSNVAMDTTSRLTNIETDSNRLDYARAGAAGAIGGAATGALFKLGYNRLGIGDNDPTGELENPDDNNPLPGDGDRDPRPPVDPGDGPGPLEGEPIDPNEPLDDPVEPEVVDSSLIDLNALPWDNAVAVGAEQPNELIQATLDQYNEVAGRNFVYNLGGDGMFVENGRIINPAELVEYNKIMQSIIDQ